MGFGAGLSLGLGAGLGAGRLVGAPFLPAGTRANMLPFVTFRPANKWTRSELLCSSLHHRLFGISWIVYKIR